MAETVPHRFYCGIYHRCCPIGITVILDVLPIAKARGFWDTDEPCYQKTVLQVLSAMDNALPIFPYYYLTREKILSPSFFIFIAAFKSLS